MLYSHLTSKIVFFHRFSKKGQLGSRVHISRIKILFSPGFFLDYTIQILSSYQSQKHVKTAFTTFICTNILRRHTHTHTQTQENNL